MFNKQKKVSFYDFLNGNYELEADQKTLIVAFATWYGMEYKINSENGNIMLVEFYKHGKEHISIVRPIWADSSFEIANLCKAVSKELEELIKLDHKMEYLGYIKKEKTNG